jgi:drug/metabolite transporter (DMT)-like permease
MTVGLLAALLAAALASGGLIIQALDAREQHHRHGLRLSLLGRLVRTPRWVIGTILGYLAFPFQLLALRHVPLIVVQPVQAAGLLLMLAVGARVLGERIERGAILGVAGVMVGLAVLSWGSPSGTDTPVTPGALGGATAGLLLISACPYAFRGCGRTILVLCAGIGFAATNLAVKGFSDALAAGASLHLLAYLACAALSSTLAILSQMTAFQRYRAVDVAPVTFAVPVFLPVALGAVILNEHWRTAAFAGAPFAAGVVLLAVATIMLTRSAPVARLSAQAS